MTCLLPFWCCQIVAEIKSLWTKKEKFTTVVMHFKKFKIIHHFGTLLAVNRITLLSSNTRLLGNTSSLVLVTSIQANASQKVEKEMRKRIHTNTTCERRLTEAHYITVWVSILKWCVEHIHLCSRTPTFLKIPYASGKGLSVLLYAYINSTNERTQENPLKT